MEILCLGQQNWDHCWTGKQQLMSRLAERGHRVLYVDPDFPKPDQDEAICAASEPGAPGLRHRGPGELWTWTYLPIRSLGWKVNKFLQPRRLPGILRRIGMHAPVTVCLHPKQIAHLDQVRSQALVYYAVDEYTGYEGMAEEERRQVRAWEEQILARAHVALAVSGGLRDRFAAICSESHVLENGSDVDHYRPKTLARRAPHPALAGIDGHVIGFIGQVDSRIDQDLIAAMAKRRPDMTFVFAGRRSEIDMRRIDSLPNVQFLGYQPYEALPSVAKRVDVWMVPYVESELTHACNPLKVYEYLATGKPVVSRPLDGLVVCRDVVRLAREPDAFLAAIDAAVADTEAGRAERLRRAEENDWYGRVKTLEAHMEEALAESRRRGDWLRAVRPLPPARAMRETLDASRAMDEYGEPRVATSDGRPAPRWRLAAAAARVALAPVHAAHTLAARGPRNVLVPWNGHLGDFIQLTPMLAHLRRILPDARITIGVPRGNLARTLFAHSPDVDEVLEIDFVPWRTEATTLERMRRFFALLSRRFDLVVSGGFWFQMEEGQLAGAPQAVSLYDGHPMQALRGRVLRRDHSRPESENNLALAEAWSGRLAAEEDRIPRLDLDEDEVAAERGRLPLALGIQAGDQVLLVHPGTKIATRRWPVERMAEAVSHVVRKVPGLVPVVTGTAGERALAEALVARLDPIARERVRDAVGQTGFPGLAALLDRADAVLSNDTGVMHFARARGAPLVALLGPENHRLWGPNAHGRALARALRHQVPCAPCHLESCAAHWCMRSLGVDEVVEALLGMLANGRNAADPAHSLRLDVTRRSWSALDREGFGIPTVSVAVDGEDLPAVLPMIEMQTYPRIEVVVVRDAAGAALKDRRDEDRRRALPFVDCARDPAANAMSAAARAASGAYVVQALPSDAWRPSRLALDVAAATRSERGRAFRDGVPVAPGAPGALSARRAPEPREGSSPTARPGAEQAAPVPTERASTA